MATPVTVVLFDRDAVGGHVVVAVPKVEDKLREWEPPDMVELRVARDGVNVPLCEYVKVLVGGGVTEKVPVAVAEKVAERVGGGVVVFDSVKVARGDTVADTLSV